MFCLPAGFLLYTAPFLKDFIYVFLEGGGEKNLCVRDPSIHCLLHAPNQGPGTQPRHVPWLGIKPATFQFTGQCSIHWATSARAALTNMLVVKNKREGVVLKLAHKFTESATLWTHPHRLSHSHRYENWGDLSKSGRIILLRKLLLHYISHALSLMSKINFCQ